jgi:hypothetical protein
MPSVERVRERRAPERSDRGVCCQSGLTQVGDVLPAVLARYGLLSTATDRAAAGAVVTHPAADNHVLADGGRMLADCRLPWDLEVAC